ncbi:MAG: hypothetical protein ABSB50_04360 [Terracidiphilus sp.]|jgi:hypothetical protein
MKEIPRELDWVIERGKCEFKTAFEALRESVKKDVEQYNTQSGLLTRYQIEFSSDPKWMFSVARRSNVMKCTVFRPVDDCIEIIVSAGTEQTLRVLPEFTEMGSRKFRIDGEEGEPMFEWQLRRRVLEPILFGN